MSELTLHVTHEWRPGHADPLAQLNERISKIMSDLETITAALTTAQGDLDQIKAFLSTQNEQLATLTARLTQLDQTTPPQVDLSSAINLANQIRDEADQIVSSFQPAAASADPTSGSATDASSGTASSPSSSSDTSGSLAADETGAAASGDVVADTSVDSGADVGNASDATVSSGGSVPDTDTANNE